MLSALMLLAPLGAGEAQAQQLIGRCQGLFGCFFGGGNRAPAVQNVPAQQRNGTGRVKRRSPPSQQGRTVRSAPQGRASAPATPPPPPAVDKIDNARVVLVVGDFLAGGLAEGLEEAYAQSPGVRIVDRSNGSSGFVRSDYFDWNGKIGSIIDEVKPDVVVVMIGSNDRQQMVLDGNRVDPRSDAWTKEYTRRIARLASSVTERKLPLVWTGLPAFKSPSMSSDMLAFNDLYKQEVETAKGEFVDIWDGFVDEAGNFIFTGPDMNGQPVRLRGSDGINLTAAGKRKVAFYAEKPLNKILGTAVGPDVDDTTIDQLPVAPAGPVGPGIVDRTPPMSLASPDLDGGTALLGGPVKPSGDGTKRTRASAPGAETPAGRADDFSLGGDERALADRAVTTSIGK